MLFTEWVSEGLRRHAIAQRRRAKKGDISFGSRECQPSNVKENCDGGLIPDSSPAIPPRPGEASFLGADAALRPHSSAVLYTIVSGMSQCGGAAASANFSISAIRSQRRGPDGRTFVYRLDLRL